MIFINRAWNDRERHLLRVMACALVVFAVLNFLGGCTTIKEKIGGEVFGVSASLAGVTLSVSGTIPTNPAPQP